MELECRRTSQLRGKHLQKTRKKDLRARDLIAGTVEPDIVQGSVVHMARHVTIVRNHFQSVCRSRKKVHGLGIEQQEEHDPESTLFGGVVTTEVQFQNDECYVMFPVTGHITNSK